jgi:hypothetical protein
MKSFLASALVLLALPLCAQTDGAAPGGAAAPPAAPAPPTIPPRVLNSPMFSTLTDADKTKFGDDYTKAMIANPDLLQEGKDLMGKAHAMHGTNPSPSDRQAMHDAMKAYFDKVRAAIIGVDPTVEPILMRIDVQQRKMHDAWKEAHPDAGN